MDKKEVIVVFVFRLSFVGLVMIFFVWVNSISGLVFFFLIVMGDNVMNYEWL